MVNNANNKAQYSLTNISHCEVLHVNASNSDFCTKIPELTATINDNMSNTVLISKANVEVDEPKKMEERAKAFPEYHFEDKLVTGKRKARCSVMISKELEYEGVKRYEDKINSTLIIRIRDSSNKWVYVMAIYRQWKLEGDFNSNYKEGIRKQENRIKSQCNNIEKMCSKNQHCLIGRDINIDKNYTMIP